MTVAAWVYRNANQSGFVTAAARQVGTTYYEHFYLGFENGNYRWLVNTSSGYSNFALGGAAPLGQWVHLVGTYDGSTVKLYANGVQQFSTPHSGTFASDTTGITFGVNHNDASRAPTEAFNGKLDEVNVYSYALTAQQVQQLYQGTVTAGGLPQGDSASSSGPPTAIAFAPSPDHSSTVLSYVVTVFQQGQLVTDLPAAVLDVGKPQVINGEIQVGHRLDGLSSPVRLVLHRRDGCGLGRGLLGRALVRVLEVGPGALLAGCYTSACASRSCWCCARWSPVGRSTVRRGSGAGRRRHRSRSRRRRRRRKPSRPRSSARSCLGTGVKTSASFCFVLAGRDPAQGVVVTIPPHVGTATLTFSLHNRHTYSEEEMRAGRGFAKYTAVVAVLTMAGDVLGRGAVQSEFRSAKDLYDRVSGGAGPGGVKAVAPIGNESVTVTIPADAQQVSLLGEVLESTTAAGREVAAPGRPVAIVSNVQLEYRPAPPARKR